METILISLRWYKKQLIKIHVLKPRYCSTFTTIISAKDYPAIFQAVSLLNTIYLPWDWGEKKIFILPENDCFFTSRSLSSGFLYPFLLIPIVAKTSQRRCLCCTKTCNLYELPSVHFSSKRRLRLSRRNTITKGCTHPGWGHCIQPFLRTGIAAENTGLKSSETMPWTRGPQAAPQNNLRHIAHKKPPELAVQ